jgi:prepilin-type N-terminal cleavage/methylation domain-containing protein
MRFSRSGFTLIELLVVIFIIGMLVGLLLPTVGGPGRTPARNNLCKNNLMQLQRALALERETHRGLPGYINVIGAKDGPKARASWVVSTLPYLEQQELWEKWSAGKPEFKAIEILICPSDPPVDETEPNLSYVVNAGYIGDAAGYENKANGLFFDRTRTAEGAPGPSDERDVAKHSLIRWNLKKVVEAEGQTMLLAENLHALYWGYISVKDQQHTKDRSFHFGFCWEQPDSLIKGGASEDVRTTRAINRNLEYREITEFAEVPTADAFPSSFHSEVANIAFVNGSVRSVHQNIDPLVYAQLMTSDRNHSDLINAAGVPDKELPQLEEGEDY